MTGTPTNAPPTLTRRAVLAASAGGGALLLGVVLGGREMAAQPSSPVPPPPATPAATPVTAADLASGAFVPNAWLRIDPDGAVTVKINKAEMGQGVLTGLATLVAEELDADWSAVRTEYAYGDPIYASPLLGIQLTFGSTSLTESWQPLRLAGATARLMLVEAAAQEWGVAVETCRTERGAVRHEPSGRSLGYGALAARAATLPVPEPETVPLKPPSAWGLIGTSPPRLDLPEKVTGRARYAADVQIPGMLTATPLRSPVFGGTVGSYDAAAALAIPGVRQVVELRAIPAGPPGEGVGEAPSGPPPVVGLAVVADGWWPAKRGRDLLAASVAWDEGPRAGQDSAAIAADMGRLLAQPGVLAAEAGDAAGALAAADRVFEAEYAAPFLAHTPMEPLSCAVHVRPDAVELWVGHQSATIVQQTAAALTGLPPAAVTIHQTLLGGGFGRRGEGDFVADAILIAQAVGAPVKVLWSREEDLQQDRYRPATRHRVKVALDPTGAISGWEHRAVGDWQGVRLPGPSGEPVDLFMIPDLPYPIANTRIEIADAGSGVPVGAWRSVGHSQNTFVIEGMVDEAAHVLGRDPLAYRRDLVASEPRAVAVLDLAAARAGWGEALAAGRGRGVALCRYGETWVAEVVEVALAGDAEDTRAFSIERIVCAADCGVVVNPDIVRAQLEGGVVHALSAALREEVTIAGGRVEQANFDGYPILRFDEIPPIEVFLVPDGEAPSGIGEVAVPPLAPALANALFAATGERMRSLPIRRSEAAR